MQLLWNRCHHHHTIIRAAFVCLFVCSLCTPRSFDGSSPNLVGVCRLTSHLPLRGSFSKRLTASLVNGSLSLSTILYMCQPHSTRCNSTFCLASSSLIQRLLLFCMSTTYVGGPGNCYWGVLFLKGQWVDGSTGQRVKWVNGSTGHFHFHYIIYDSRRRQAHATPLQKAHRVNGLTGQWVDGSTGQRVKWVNGSTGHFHFHYIIYDSRRRQAHTTQLQKAHRVFCSLDG